MKTFIFIICFALFSVFAVAGDHGNETNWLNSVVDAKVHQTITGGEFDSIDAQTYGRHHETENNHMPTLFTVPAKAGIVVMAYSSPFVSVSDLPIEIGWRYQN